MDKYNVIILIGKSGSGKDSIATNLSLLPDEQFHKVISATTRPKRDNEEEGKDYFFVNIEEFEKMKMIETDCFNNWYYGTPYSSLDKNKCNVLVTTPDGVLNLLEDEQINIIAVYYIEASDRTRILRQINRELMPNIKEVVRRFQTDEKDFYRIKKIFPYFKDLNFKVISNEDSIWSCCSQIIDDLNNWSKVVND